MRKKISKSLFVILTVIMLLVCVGVCASLAATQDDYAYSVESCSHKYTNACDNTCNLCGEKRTTTHSYKTATTKATLTKNGNTKTACTVCDYVKTDKVLYSPKTFTLSATSLTYNGAVRTPTVTVKDAAGNVLKKGTDYTVTYASGRKDIGTYKVTVKMKGNYSGTKTLSFKINPINISTCTVKLSATSLTYNGNVRTPAVTVTNSYGTRLTKNKHYTVTYSDGRKDIGTYKVTIKMIGNYTGQKTLTFKINPIDISTCTVKLAATDLTYNGNVRAPAVKVTNSYGTRLTKNKHYTVTYSDGRKDIGTYKVTIKMIGNYTGQKTLTFKINPIDISTCTVKLAATELTYNGNVRAPAVTVRNSYGTRLTKDKHYTVTYSDGRKDIGTYKVTIKMIGNYTGQKTLTFKIIPIDISTCKIYMLSTKLAYNGEVQPATEIAYNGKVQTPAVMVVNSYGTKLTQDKHYTIKYAAGRKNVGTYNITVKMKGNYTGTATISFVIKPTLKTSETLLIAKTAKIDAKSNAKITYKSSDTSVAKVSSEGVITAVKAGTATITVTSNKISQKITVKVTNPSIKLNSTATTVGRYSYVKLKATTNPSAATVKWTSSNTAVAKVSSKGKVTPVKAGSCTITASITYNGKTYKATCSVKVINQQPITITDAYWAIGMYSEGAEIEPGTALALRIKNNTNKNIKRIEIKTTYRDKYAAPAYCVINNIYTKTLKTGELAGNSRDIFTWEPAIFSCDVHRIDITTIKVIFTDNTTATFDYDMYFYDSEYHYQ